ncbi:DUF523 domain-containing protein [Spongiactinospora gelatinilytica]|uniref:DUF523 domain-containing protein n=1 Tax=Spongiactinospora gelatinilytica TaxID=2666298 RepID=A0A2W2IWZ3_9ACTN|nr:DUF523 domain-containing protein [Spongiactinospora gelatinilytica]PZG54154.1 DUF523 domain-containing protein [Spongiactinospora gelatinilytica]
MERILVSACLLGRRVRFDGGAKTSGDALLAEWRAQGRLVPVCPEVDGGLPVPRPPAEIEDGAGGPAVLSGTARVLTPQGADVTAAYLAGAERALATAERYGVRIAILKEGSPSCGALAVHDGTFRGRKIPGQGVTTALLTGHGIRVFTEAQIPEAATYLTSLEPPSAPTSP